MAKRRKKAAGEVVMLKGDLTGAVKPPLKERTAPEDESYSVELGADGLPYCCGVTVFGHACVCEDNRGDTYGYEGGSSDGPEEAVQALADQIANELPQRGLALYTTIESQLLERKALDKVGFKPIAIFKGNNNYAVTLHGYTPPVARRRR